MQIYGKLERFLKLTLIQTNHFKRINRCAFLMPSNEVTHGQFIIKASKQITLPVTPESFEVSFGQRIESVNIHEVSDVNLSGGMALGTIKSGGRFYKEHTLFIV